MDDKKIKYFQERLLKARTDIVNSGILNDFEDLKVQAEDLADDADLASNTINQQVTFSIREKEINKLKRIDAALARIEEGRFGFCLESGEEIAPKRLEGQPWAEYCLEVAEEMEREHNQKFRHRA